MALCCKRLHNKIIKVRFKGNCVNFKAVIIIACSVIQTCEKGICLSLCYDIIPLGLTILDTEKFKAKVLADLVSGKGFWIIDENFQPRSSQHPHDGGGACQQLRTHSDSQQHDPPYI